MNAMVLTRIYTVMLMVEASLFTLLFVRCAVAIWKNHLEHRVRMVIVGTLVLSLTGAFESWVRSWGRVQQMCLSITPTQANPELALIALVIADLGLMVWIMTLEVMTHFGTIGEDVPRRRAGDPRRKEG